jgi:hypothetical protein
LFAFALKINLSRFMTLIGCGAPFVSATVRAARHWQ